MCRGVNQSPILRMCRICCYIIIVADLIIARKHTFNCNYNQFSQDHFADYLKNLYVLFFSIYSLNVQSLVFICWFLNFIELWFLTYWYLFIFVFTRNWVYYIYQFFFLQYVNYFSPVQTYSYPGISGNWLSRVIGFLFQSPWQTCPKKELKHKLKFIILELF